MTEREQVLKDIGSRIAKCRKEQGLTQEELSEKCDLNPQYISYAETGRRAMRIDNLKRISEALNVSADYLLTGNVADKDASLLSEKMKKLSSPLQDSIEAFINQCINISNKTDKG